VPPGGLDEQVLGNTAGAPAWKDFAYSGFSARFGANFTSTSLKDTLDKIINIVYIPPTVVLSGTINFLREIGTVVSGITLTANVTRTSNPLTIIQILDGGTVLLNLNPPASPNSQNASVGFATPFSNNKTFTAVAEDGTGTGNASLTYNFVYPYYMAPGPTGLTPAQVGTLQKNISASSATINNTFNVVGAQKYYFAQLASYPPLTSILDVSNFDTLSDWTVTVGNITGLDATVQSYRIYEFNNIVSTGAYFYSFRR
jgi:hypothetical protein